MYYLTRVLVSVATISVLSACGVSGNLRNDPGFAAFESPGIHDSDREFALSLGPLPLRLARAVMDDDPDAAAMLRQLRAVRIYVYEIDGDAERVREKLESNAAGLTEQGWMPVVTVREDDELLSALVKMGQDNQIRGLVVIAQDHEEVIFVNLIGRLRPESFNDLLSEFDVNLRDINIDSG